MITTSLGHVLFSIGPSNVGFYRDLLGFLGWSTIMDVDGSLGVGSPKGESLWFGAATSAAANDFDAPGVNHLAFSAASIADVDAAVAYLRERGIPALFETPRHRPDFGMGAGQTYYQVMFESPDHILFEVVYTGPFDG